MGEVGIKALRWKEAQCTEGQEKDSVTGEWRTQGRVARGEVAEIGRI